MEKALVRHASLSGHDPEAVASRSTRRSSPPHPPHAFSSPPTSTQQPPYSKAPDSLPQSPLDFTAATVKPSSGFKRIIRRLRPTWLTRRINREHHTASVIPEAVCGVLEMPTIAIIPPSVEATPQAVLPEVRSHSPQTHTEARKSLRRLRPSWTKKGDQVDDNQSRGRSESKKVLVGTLKFGTDLLEESRTEVISMSTPVIAPAHEGVTPEVEVHLGDDPSVEAAQDGHEPPLDELEFPGVAIVSNVEDGAVSAPGDADRRPRVPEADVRTVSPSPNDAAPAKHEVPLLKALNVDGLDTIDDLDNSAQPPPRPPRSPARKLFTFPSSPQTQSPTDDPTDGANTLGLDVDDEVSPPQAEWTENGLKVPSIDSPHSVATFDADSSAVFEAAPVLASEEAQDAIVADDDALAKESPAPTTSGAEVPIMPEELAIALVGLEAAGEAPATVLVEEQGEATNADKKKRKESKAKVEANDSVALPEQHITKGADKKKRKKKSKKAKGKKAIDVERLTPAQGHGPAPGTAVSLEVVPSSELGESPVDPAQPVTATGADVRTVPLQVVASPNLAENQAHLHEVVSRQPIAVAATPLEHRAASPAPPIRSQPLTEHLPHDIGDQGKAVQHEDGRIHNEWPAQEGEAIGTPWPRPSDSPPAPPGVRRLLPTEVARFNSNVRFIHDDLDLNLEIHLKADRDEPDSPPPSPGDPMDHTFNGIWKPFNHARILCVEDPASSGNPFLPLEPQPFIDPSRLSYVRYPNHPLRFSFQFQENMWLSYDPHGKGIYRLLNVMSRDDVGCIMRASDYAPRSSAPPGLPSPKKTLFNIRVTQKVYTHASERTLSGLKREISALKAVTERKMYDAFIMPMLSMWEDDLNVYQVFPSYVCNLAQWMKVCPPEVFPVYLYTAELALALHALHRAGIVHANIQMEHVFVTADGHLLLGGLDSACRKGAKTQEWPRAEGAYLAYRAPETFRKEMEGAQPRTGEDVYALGILFIEMYEGHRADLPLLPPRGTPEWQEFVQQRASMDVVREHPYVRVLIGRYPELWDLLSHMLHRNPAKRWPINRVKEHAYFELLDKAKVRARAPDYDSEELFVPHGRPQDFVKYLPREQEIDVADFMDRRMITTSGDEHAMTVTLPAATFRNMLGVASGPLSLWFWDHQEAHQWWKRYTLGMEWQTRVMGQGGW